MSSEKFCLRWNDFERNISSAFRDIRDEKEFFDITIACDDEQLQAHKVILSACSPFFKNVLRRNQHQHPLLYLKGVSFKDMEAVLNFMYHGEVNVAQDDLNSFLQVAEDLRVKGLTQNNSTNAVEQNTKEIDVLKTNNRSSNANTSSVKRPRPSPSLPKTTHPVTQQEEEIEEIIPVVKSEPRDPSPITMTAPIQPVVQQQQSMAMYNDRSQMAGSMMTSMDTEQYDDSYEGDYAGQYGEESYDGHQGVGGQDVGAGLTGICPYCSKEMRKSNLSRHIRVQHTEEQPEQCEICNKVFKRQNVPPKIIVISSVFFTWFIHILGRGECPICFKQMLKNNIQKHIKVKHSEEEPVDCPQCGKPFKTSYYMKEHLRNIHGIGKRQAY